MALEGQKTTSDYLEWEKFQYLIDELEKEGETKFALLISSGCYLGLRISDLLQLKWNQLYCNTKLTITEQKTGKERTLTIHPELESIVDRLYNNQPLEEYIFINRYKTKPINIQYVNRKLKTIMQHYHIKGRYSSHFMRKTLGRRIWNQNNNSEKALVLLGQLFNHSSIQTTKIYLGIRQKEIRNIYLTL